MLVQRFVADGSLRLASFESLVDTHLDMMHGGAIPAENEAAIALAVGKKEKAAQKVAQLATSFGFVAAVAQAAVAQATGVKSTPPTAPAKPSKAVGSGTSLSPMDLDLTPEGGPTMCPILRLPMDTPTKGTAESTRQSMLIPAEYKKVQTPGSVVSDDVFDLLRKTEMTNFLERAPQLSDVQLSDVRCWPSISGLEHCAQSCAGRGSPRRW